MERKLVLFLLFLFVTGAACSSSTSNSGGSTTTGLKFSAAADFDASAQASISPILKTTTGVCEDLSTPITNDDPGLTDGLDCDNDNGIVAHITPTKYSIAFKRATLKSADNVVANDIDLIADTATLAASEVVDFTEADSSESIIIIEPGDLEAGTYSGVEVEIYYFQLTFPVAGTTQNVRFYMSDDDFPSEGSLGHHQGDITFIGDDGTENGWIDSTWLSVNLSSTRTADQNGAGGTDAETTHARGFFGDEDFWNQTDLVRGAGQDIYITILDFDTPLMVSNPATITNLTTITATFSVADTFFFEDFPAYGTGGNADADFSGFYPGTEGGDAGGNADCAADPACDPAWAPATPVATLSTTTSG